MNHIIWIVKYHKKNPPRCMAFTYSEDEARELCSKEETHGENWFFGWTREDGHRGANVNQLATAKGYLRDIAREPNKKVTS